MTEIFIDGWQGTTGLKIISRLKERDDLKVVVLEGEERKSLSSRVRAIEKADITVLCLPDAAAKEIVACVPEYVRIIDASTAHRTDPEWAYGMPELGSEYRERIASSNRVANPGCHASGVIAILYPLIKTGVLAPESLLSVTSITGYSGGGKSMIADYEEKGYRYPRAYAPLQTHKHLPEMKAVCGLTRTPAFNPYVCDYYCGMTVNVPLFVDMLAQKVSVADVKELLRAHYAGAHFVTVGEEPSGYVSANLLNGTNRMELLVNGNERQILLTARFDNLGKGASGAAIQNMNLALGLDECLSL